MIRSDTKSGFRGGVYTGKGFDWEPIPSAVRLKAPAHAGDTF